MKSLCYISEKNNCSKHKHEMPKKIMASWLVRNLEELVIWTNQNPVLNCALRKLRRYCFGFSFCLVLARLLTVWNFVRASM